ncbi:MAG: hypothetical protein MUP66_02155 [Candidatus Nanohaloarchaeota archaeon QJJ-5]|nr:hypothetical protein [Candidatus Nanohaloarchaeota archaeon QJJ-5]
MTDHQYMDTVIDASTDLVSGIAKGLDLPAYVQDAATYDEQRGDEIYSLGARMDGDRAYAPGDDEDFAYDVGTTVGAGLPAVAFFSTANPVFLAPYAPSTVIGGIKSVERYLQQDGLDHDNNERT